MSVCPRCKAVYSGKGIVCHSCVGRPHSPAELRAVAAGATAQIPAPPAMDVDGIEHTVELATARAPSRTAGSGARRRSGESERAVSKRPVTGEARGRETPLLGTSAPGTAGGPCATPGVADASGAGPEAAAEDPFIGQTPLGQYRITRKIGEGGFGAVYLADQLGVGRKAVIKILHQKLVDSDVFVKRFEREAAVLASLDHHHLVRLYNFGELDGGQLFLAMEYGGDTTVAEEIARQRRLAPERALLIASQVCEALEQVHAHGIVHRDLKPANVILDKRAGADWAKVVDVGIAKIVGSDEFDQKASTLTAAGMIIGTPAYLSPEQARGLALDSRSDLYSLGCVLYEMLTGRLPIHCATPIDYVRAHTVDPPTPTKSAGVNLPAYVDAVVFRALEKAPEKRFQSAAEMGTALKAARERLLAPSRGPRSSIKKIAIGAAGAGLAAALSLFLPPLLARRKPPRPSRPAPTAEVSATTLVPGPPQEPPPTAPQGPQARELAEEPRAAASIEPRRSRGHGPSAASALGARSTSSPADAPAARLMTEAGSLARSSSLEAAIAKLQEAVDLQPSGPVKGKAYKSLAALHYRTGNGPEALKYYELSRSYCPPGEIAAVEAAMRKIQAELEFVPSR